MFRWMQRPEKRDLGWTLLELVIAFAIVAIISAIAIPIFLSQNARAEQAVLESNLASAYSLLYTAGYEGAVLPSSLPADVTTEIGDAGSFTPNYTLTVFGNSASTICVQGETPDGFQMMGDAGGVREGTCTPPFAYLDTSFLAGENNEILSPTLDNRLGDPTFTATGALPEGVTFDSDTGQFTGPATEQWRFQAVQIAAGGGFTCTLTTLGTVKCWGQNTSGQLGNGSGGGIDIVDVTGLPSGDPVVQIAAGENHACAVTESGAAYCWGSNSDGQLGNGTTSNSSTAVAVTGYGSNVESIAAGGNTTCLVTDSSSLACFGNGAYGQLGNAANSDSSTPVTPNGLDSGVQSVSVGSSHVCAVTSGGNISCFGAGSQGQLGQGTSIGSNIPVNVQGVATATAVAVGDNHTCAIFSGGSVSCWGQNSDGQLGNGTTTGSSNTPAPVPGVAGVNALTASSNHTCAQTSSGNLECWGGNGNGQLGSLDAGGTRNAAALVTGASNINNTSTGANHTCAVLDDKSVQCWGSGAKGQLGYDPTGEPDYTTVPAEPYCTGSAVLNAATNECVTTTTNPGFYTCPSGGTLNDTSCDTPVYVPPVTTYSCPSGGNLSGTTCFYPYSYYTCPSGSTLSGTTCATPTTVYTCPSGGNLSGTTCTVQTITSWECDTQAAAAAGYYNINEGRIIRDPNDSNRCRWETWVCPSPWEKVSGSLCRYLGGTQTSSTQCSVLSAELAYTAIGTFPRNVTSGWTQGTSSTTYSCPNGGTRSGTTCTQTRTASSGGKQCSTISNKSTYCESGYTAITWSWTGSTCSITCQRTYTATANTTTTSGYCTYRSYTYNFNANSLLRAGFAARPVYSNSNYPATGTPGFDYSTATLTSETRSYAATANVTAGYWTTSSYNATWNAPYTTDSSSPAPFTEAKEFVPTPTTVLGSGEQPGFPAPLTILATYPNGTTHTEQIELTIDYPVARQQ